MHDNHPISRVLSFGAILPAALVLALVFGLDACKSASAQSLPDSASVSSWEELAGERRADYPPRWIQANPGAIQTQIWIDADTWVLPSTRPLVVEAWETWDTIEPETFGDVASVSVTRQLVRTNCTRRTRTRLSTTYYDARSQHLESRQIASPRPRTVVPESIGEEVFEFLCERARLGAEAETPNGP